MKKKIEKVAKKEADELFSGFKNYFTSELRILEIVGYEISDYYCRAFSRRARVFLANHIKDVSKISFKENPNADRQAIRNLLKSKRAARKEFINRTVACLAELAEKYDYKHGLLGSVPEDIGKRLFSLSKWVKKKYVTDKTHAKG
jgi:hypothetical protein